jgi:hypothetical protein
MKKINPRQNGIITLVFLVLICALLLQACDIESPYLDVIGQKIANDTSDDVELSSLTLSTGILFPAFSRTVTQYYVSLYSTTDSVTVTAAASFPYAGLTINGTAVSPEDPSVDINLSPGHNGLLIEVTSSSGTATQEYKISVHRAVVDLPRTGQTNGYTEGDDGNLAEGVPWPSPRFIDNGNTITDNLTGLMWVKAPDLTTRTWEEALAYANGLDGVDVDFHNDWRLPNRAELRSLFNYQRANTATWLDPSQGFSGVQSSYYWTSTTCGPDTGRAWSLFMSLGIVDFIQKTPTTFYAFPVRTGETVSTISLPKTGQIESYSTTDGEDGDLEIGVPWPTPRFTDNGNGTITDNLTGLMWEKAPSNTIQDWADSITYANDLTLAGFDDWHLPNINELESIFNSGAEDIIAWMESQGFEDVPSGVFWSSTTYAPFTNDAWFIKIHSTLWGGYLFHQNKTTMPFGDGYAFAVRSGQ